MQRIIWLALIALTCWGCSNGQGTITSEDAVVDVVEAADVVADLIAQEVVPEKDAVDLGPSLDLTPGTPDFPTDLPLGCEPGEGCFGDQCTENGQCQSGWCVENMGEGICTISCEQECPAGWTCSQVGVGPDILFLCISDFANLCKPCSINSDCKTVGGADDVCIDYGDGGNFCGGLCTEGGNCPWGFSCEEAVTVEGVEVTQCVADAGVCPCTGKSVQLSLATPCQVVNEFGVCTGMRVCDEDGLSDCDAGTPDIEVCNGVDDDCDGDVDEPEEVGGDYVNLCDDGNACTEETCDGEAGCVYESLNEGECMDGDVCTVGDHCEAGQCIGLPIVCDDGNPCTDDMCDGLGGCDAKSNTVACDDGQPCTVADACQDGACAGFPVDCDCETDDDCLAFDDGDLCNGTLVCNKEAFPYQCTVDAATVVECLPMDETVCALAICVPETGDCTVEPDHEGFACDDHNACTVGDQCAEGTCTAGVDVICEDANQCTDDLCNPEVGCQYTNNSSVCSDNDACTSFDACQEGACVGGAQLPCDDGNVCTDDSCDPQAGCLHAANDAPCNDGNDCTPEDQCAAGICVSSGMLDCDDGNPCTKDTCTADGGCLSYPVAGICDDGDPCTVADQCVNGACISGDTKNCDDNNPCTSEGCNEDGQCVYSMLDGVCDDGNSCTSGDHCQAGQCVYDEFLDCDDENPCTKDSCNPQGGCVNVNADGACDDGDPCTDNDFCANGLCVSGAAQQCDDGNPCTDDSCAPDGTCLFEPNSDPCSDGTVCTENDLCAAGECQPGVLLECGDDNVCTDTYCDPVEGCVVVLNDAFCDDEDVCSTGDHCHLGECISSGQLSCQDGNPCTDDSCNPAAGCEFLPNTDPCDDQNTCTVDDQCEGGFCAPGEGAACDDENVCTDDYCDVIVGCLYINNSNPCNDLDACTANEFCANAACGGGVSIICDDENICTDDSCSPDSGCVFDANAEPCSDDDECTDGDQCQDEECVAGPPLVCDDLNVCTDDSCAPDSGCINAPVPDETSCGQDLWCKSGNCQPICNYVAGSLTLNYSGSLTTFTVPECVTDLTIEVWGAQGGMGNSGAGGLGARMKGVFEVTEGQTLKVLVGQQGQKNSTSGGHIGNSTGGGGGTYVTKADNTPLIIAGAGGGGGHVNGGQDGVTGPNGLKGLGGGGASGGTNGNGGGSDGGMNSGRAGAGLTGDGGIPPGDGGVAPGGSKSFVNGGAGGPAGPHHGAGGFGGGGQGGNYGGGGGGGYSGGGGGSSNGYGGGGGGSYNDGAGQSNQAGVQAGNGKAVFTW